MEPIMLFELSYKTVTVINALAKIQSGNKTLEHLSDIKSTLQSIENIFQIQILQPLKSGLSMLADAESEYSVNQSSGQELARNALDNFNRAEGQLSDPQNQLVALAGKACAYKLLDMRGAYNSAAQNANQLYLSLKPKSDYEDDYVIRLRKIVSENLDVDISEVKPKVSFQGDLGADSLDAVELIMSIEEEFDIEIPDQDTERIITFQDAIRYLESRL